MRTELIAALALLMVTAGCTRPGTPGDAEGPAAPAAPTASGDATSATSFAITAPASPAPATPVVRLALSAEGLDFVSEQGSVRHLRFGVPAAQAIDAASRIHGTAPERGRNEECGAGPLEMASWPSGLTLLMQDDRFVGWGASAGTDAGQAGSALATIAGVGPGSTRGELDAAYAAKVEETTLGQEFAAGDLFGVLDGSGPTARIEVMWAGTSCNFR